MIEPVPVLPDVSLRPGELMLARRPAILRTILGSCVGVTIWSPRLRAGALCHCLLPVCPEPWSPGSNYPDGHRYVDFTIRHLANEFDVLGAFWHELEVKLFGGADVLPTGNRLGKTTIGTLNCLAAERVLADEGLHIAASDVGGDRGRTIHFHTGTGEVLLYRLEAWRGLNP